MKKIVFFMTLPFILALIVNNFIPTKTLTPVEDDEFARSISGDTEAHLTRVFEKTTLDKDHQGTTHPPPSSLEHEVRHEDMIVDLDSCRQFSLDHIDLKMACLNLIVSTSELDLEEKNQLLKDELESIDCKNTTNPVKCNYYLISCLNNLSQISVMEPEELVRLSDLVLLQVNNPQAQDSLPQQSRMPASDTE